MKKIVKFLRNIYPVNWLIRRLIRYNLLNRNLYRYWPLKGNSHIKILNQKIRFYSNCDDYLFSKLYYDSHSFEPNEIRLIFRLGNSIKTFIDIGANTGLYSILVNKLEPNIRIFSFEPHPQNFQRLKRNLALNKITEADLSQTAVGVESKKNSFYVPENDSITDISSFNQEFSERIANAKFRAIDVKTVTLDEYFLDVNLQSEILIKIDVEGFELDVLKGGLRMVEKYRPLIFCEIFTKYFENIHEYAQRLPKVQQFEQLIKSAKYNIFRIMAEGTLKEVDSLNQPMLSNNLLFVPSEKSLDQIYGE